MNVRTFAIARAVAVIGGTSALIVGATFAATTTNAVTATGAVAVSDNLSISSDHVNYGPSASGFVFSTAPGSPSVAHTHIYLETTEPANSVKLSAKITTWNTNVSAEESHLTMNFMLNGNTVSIPFSALGGSSDSSLAGLGALANTGSTSNDLEAWVTADASTPVLNALNDFTLQLTGTSDGTVSH
ncbi:MAG TPA: hypothetical protein VGH44_01115 [Candidatus Saccharimonadia bacterium]